MTDRRPEWMRALRRLVRNSAPADPAAPVPTFGTVRGLNPLRVALDTDPATTLNYEPPCLDYPTFVGQRVWVQTYGRQVVIVGVSKSAPDLPVGSGGIWTAPAGAGKTPPMPWMLAEGQLLPRAEYPELSALYGNTFAGSNATHVALPDARGRTAVHFESGSSRFGTIGQHYGTKDETLTVDQMPSHGHYAPDGTWMFYVESMDGDMRRSSQIVNAGLAGESGVWRQRVAETAGTVRLPTASAGGGQSHNNVQPSLVLRYMVKVR